VEETDRGIVDRMACENEREGTWPNPTPTAKRERTNRIVAPSILPSSRDATILSYRRAGWVSAVCHDMIGDFDLFYSVFLLGVNRRAWIYLAPAGFLIPCYDS
jgi:hypothetical protein